METNILTGYDEIKECCTKSIDQPYINVFTLDILKYLNNKSIKNDLLFPYNIIPKLIGFDISDKKEINLGNILGRISFFMNSTSYIDDLLLLRDNYTLDDLVITLIVAGNILTPLHCDIKLIECKDQKFIEYLANSETDYMMIHLNNLEHIIAGKERYTSVSKHDTYTYYKEIYNIYDVAKYIDSNDAMIVDITSIQKPRYLKTNIQKLLYFIKDYIISGNSEFTSESLSNYKPDKSSIELIKLNQFDYGTVRQN